MVRKKRLFIGIIPVFVIGLLLCSKSISRIIEVKSNTYGAPANSAFTDENFYKCVVDAYNGKNGTSLGYDVNLSDEQLASLTILNCSGDNKEEADIVRNTNGLNKLVNITYLDFSYNNILSIDLSNNAMLEEINLKSNHLSTIDVSNNVNLKKLYLTNNNLTNIDLKNNINLESLQLGDVFRWDGPPFSWSGPIELNTDGNVIIKLNLEDNVNIKELWLSSLGLEELIIPENNNIKYMYNSNNNLKDFNFLNYLGSELITLDLSNTGLLSFKNFTFINLKNLILDENAEITELETDGFSHLKFLSIRGLSNLDSLDISSNIELLELLATQTNLSYVDLTNNAELFWLELELKGFNKIALDRLSRTNNQKVEYTDVINANLYSTDVYHFGSDFDRISDLNFDDYYVVNDKNHYIGSVDKENSNIKLGFGNYEISISGYDKSEENPLLKKTVKLNYNFSVADIFTTSSDVVVEEQNSLFFIKDDSNWIEKVYVRNGTGYLKNNKYIVECNDEVVKEFDLVHINSDKYQINKSNDDFYIFTGFDTDKNIILGNIEVSDGFQKDIIENKLVIKRNGAVVKEFDIVSISSDIYNLNEYDSSKKLLTIDNGQDIISSIDVSNASKELSFLESGEAVGLDIIKDDICLYTIELAYAFSEKYDLRQENINVVEDNIDDFRSNFRTFNCMFVIMRDGKKKFSGSFAAGDSLAIVENNEILKEYNLLFNAKGVGIDIENVNLNLDTKKTYQLSANVIPDYAENKNVTWESSNPSIATVDANGLVTAKSYGETTITVKTEEGEFTDTCNVVVSEITTYTVTFKDGDNTYTSEFEENEDIVFKTDLNKTGYKLVGWKYNNHDYSLTDKLPMPSENIELTSIWELVIPEVKNYESDDNNITGISLKTNVDNLNLGIDSIYQVKVSKHDGSDKTSGLVGTGDKVKIYLDNQLVSEYDVIIKGDVTGTGTSTVSDVAKLYQYLKGKVTMDDCYVKAGNVVDSDSTIKVNDVAKLYQFIKGKINNL